MLPVKTATSFFVTLVQLNFLEKKRVSICTASAAQEDSTQRGDVSQNAERKHGPAVWQVPMSQRIRTRRHSGGVSSKARGRNSGGSCRNSEAVREVCRRP